VSLAEMSQNSADYMHTLLGAGLSFSNKEERP